MSAHVPSRGDAKAGKGGKHSPHTKRTQRRVTEAEVAYIQAHPLDTAQSLGDWLGRSASSVAHIRERYGRSAPRRGVCWSCDSRPVWEESPEALRMGLCKGCYLDEMEAREREAVRDNAYRQRKFKRRRRSGGGEA